MALSCSAIASHLPISLTADQLIPFTDLSESAQSQWGAALPPTATPCIVYPNTQTELAAIITQAHQHQWRLLIVGHGSKVNWGRTASAIDLVVCTTRLQRLIDHAVGDLTVTVEAGMPFVDLQQHLAAQNQWMALDPAYPEQATIGGIVATRDAGALRHRYGGVRDQVLGIQFIRHDGQPVKAGGRVVKNVAGYDLMKLFTGSFGTLGILSEITLRLYPIQETSATMVVAGVSAEIASLTQALLKSTLTPTAVDLLTPQLLTETGLTGELGLAVRFQSVAASVTAQCERLQALVPPSLTTVQLTAEQDAPFWQRIHDQLWQAPTAVIAKFGSLLTAAPHLLTTFTQLVQPHGITLTGRCHAGSGLGVLRLTGPVTPALVQLLRSHCQTAQGFLTLLTAPSPLKQAIDVWGYDGNAIASMRKIKAQFDPHALLNPDRFLDGL